MFFRRRKTEPEAPRHFAPPTGFEETLNFYTWIIYFNWLSSIDIYAYEEDHDNHKKGDIVMYVRRIHEFKHMLSCHYPEIHDYIYSQLGYEPNKDDGHGDRLILCFHEPDSFLFSCPKEKFCARFKKAGNTVTIQDFTIFERHIHFYFDTIDYHTRILRYHDFKKYVDRYMMQ